MKELSINDFRCFSEVKVSFKPGINLIVGDNGSGKTSLLKACKYVLSSFFSGFSDENTSWISPMASDFRQVVKNGVTLPEKQIELTYSFFGNTFPAITDKKSEGSTKLLNPAANERSFSLIKKSKKNAKPMTSGISAFKHYAATLAADLYQADGNEKGIRAYPLPLFAAFSTEDIHSSRKLQPSKFSDYNPKASLGYYECLNGAGLLQYWIKRLLVLAEAETNHTEASTVKNAVIQALGHDGCGIINDISVRPNKKKVYFILSDGREVETDLLPDGYKRLVNIVIDLAFRATLLNREIYGNAATEKTAGCVLIDEIDLHLHPTLQTNILSSLQKTFPNLQFIATTHAPMVMGSVKYDSSDSVSRITYHDGKYSITPVDPYGLDASAIIEHILDISPRNPETQAKLAELFNLIDSNSFDEAKAALAALSRQFGDRLPELSQASTMIEMLSD